MSETETENPTELVGSQTFNMGDQEVNAWGRPHDEDVTFDDGANDNYDQMTIAGLKDELKVRQEAGRDIDTSNIKKKSQLIAALRDDDRAQASEAAGEDDEPEQ